MKELRSLFASAISAIVSIVSVTAVTIAAELSPSFKTVLTNISGHHWVTKSWMSLLVFVVVFSMAYQLQPTPSASHVRKILTSLLFVAAGGFILLLGFFIWEYVK